MYKSLIIIIFIFAKINLFSEVNYEPMFSTLFGGRSIEFIRSVDTDSEGNIYLTGATKSSDFPVSSNALQSKLSGGYDVFIMKLDPEGKIIYSSYIGSKIDNAAYELILDKKENIWIVGETSGPFLTASENAIQKNTSGGHADGFILKLNKEFEIEYFTYCGGSEYEAVTALAVDEENIVWFSGQSLSRNLPVTTNAPQKQNNGGWDGFFGKIDENNEVQLLTFYGASGNEKCSEGLGINSKGNPVITGWTTSNDFEMKNAFQNTIGGSVDVYIAEIDKSTGVSINSSFLGGFEDDRAYNLEIDEDDNIFISGFSFSNNFPLKNNVISSDKARGNGDIFVFQISPNWDLVWSTMFGGNSPDGMYGPDSYQGGITLFENNIALSTKVASNDFPTTTGSFAENYSNGGDAIICILEKGGGLIYSSYLGGSDNDRGFNVKFDNDGSLLVCGETASNDFKQFNSSALHSGSMDGFLTKFSQKVEIGDCPGGSFDFPSFNVSNEIVFSSDATLNDDVVRLTDKEMFRNGGVWYEEGVFTHAGFKTSFSFKFSEGNNYGIIDGSLPGADGIAFVIQANEEVKSGGFGGDIGYAGIKNSLAIEIDTYKNFAKGYEDPNGNHIALFCNGDGPNNSNHNGSALIAETTEIPTIMQDSVYTCTIEYGNDMFLIYLNKEGESQNLVMQVPDFSIKDKLDLSINGLPFVGIVSATGNSVERHDILSWDFCSNIGFDFTSVDGEYNENTLIDIYPNPSDDFVNINSDFNPSSIKITNSIGQIIFESDKNISKSIKVNTKDFSRGVYFIEIKGMVNNLEETKFGKFIKK